MVAADGGCCAACYVYSQGRPSGVLIVTDSTPEVKVELVKVVAPSMNSSQGEHSCPPRRSAPPAAHAPCCRSADSQPAALTGGATTCCVRVRVRRQGSTTTSRNLSRRSSSIPSWRRAMGPPIWRRHEEGNNEYIASERTSLWPRSPIRLYPMPVTR